MTQHATTTSVDAAPSDSDTPQSPDLSLDAADRLLRGMPEEIRKTFDITQQRAIGDALAKAKNGRFFVNLRFTLLGVFFAFLIGQENRSAARRKVERAKHPFFTVGNLLYMVFIWPIGVVLGWVTYVLIAHGSF